MNLPTILLLENVPDLLSKKHIHNFKKWEQKLREFGYSNYVEILNAKDYGIPQNRKRVFMVSVLGDYAYDFPRKMKLKYKLKDMLETEVDEKYYLSDKRIEDIKSWNAYEKPLENMEKIDKSQILGTITTRTGAYAAGMALIKESCPNKVNVVGNYGNGHHAKDIYDTSGLMATITTGNHSLGQTIMIKNNTKKGYEIAENGDGIDISGRMESHRGTVQKGMAQTINTKGTDGGVVVNEQEILERINSGEDLEIETTKIEQLPNNSNLRIRKLTPKECLRLMGFTDKDYEHLVEFGLSSSQIYHCAGDSIVVSCIIGLISSISGDTGKHIAINEKYIESEIKNGNKQDL